MAGLLKSALSAERKHHIDLTHLLIKENIMFSEQGNFAGVVIMKFITEAIDD